MPRYMHNPWTQALEALGEDVASTGAMTMGMARLGCCQMLSGLQAWRGGDRAKAAVPGEFLELVTHLATPRSQDSPGNLSP